MKEIPNVTTMDDLVMKIGELYLDVFNKGKVISQALIQVEELKKERDANVSQFSEAEAKLKTQEHQIKTMTDYKAKSKELDTEKNGKIIQKNLAIKDLTQQLDTTNDELQSLKESLKIEKIKLRQAEVVPFKRVPAKVKKVAKKKTQAKA